jgi:hypothetical protein
MQDKIKSKTKKARRALRCIALHAIAIAFLHGLRRMRKDFFHSLLASFVKMHYGPFFTDLHHIMGYKD